MKQFYFFLFFFLFIVSNDCIPQSLQHCFLTSNEKKESDASAYLKTSLQLSDSFDFRYVNGFTHKDEQGFTHERYRQYYKGIAIINSDIRIHKKNGEIISANGEYINEQQIDTTHKLPFSDAKEIAKKQISASYKIIPDKVLIADQKEEVFLYITGSSIKMTYIIKVYSLEYLIREDVYVDANNGKILNRLSNVQRDFFKKNKNRRQMNKSTHLCCVHFLGKAKIPEQRSLPMPQGVSRHGG